MNNDKNLEINGGDRSTNKHESQIGSPNKINMTNDMDSPGIDAKFSLGEVENEEVRKEMSKINETIEDLDVKLNLVLAQQEYEYLRSYNIFVKRKEKELRELIEKLNEKNLNSGKQDEKIMNLEKTIQSIRDDQMRMEKEKDE